MKKHHWLAFGLCLAALGLLLSGCKMPAPNLSSPAATPAPTTSGSAATPSHTPTAGAVPAPLAEEILPLPLLYLSPDADGLNQLWLLEKDGQTQRQISQSAQPLWEYALSQNGLSPKRLAYITGSPQLSRLWFAALGENQAQSIFEAAAPVQISGLSWQPGADRLAFGVQGGPGSGVYFFEPTQNTIRLVLAAPPDQQYIPRSWSPDGGWLLLGQSDVAGQSGLLLWQPESGELRPIPQSPCCQYTWDAASLDLLLSNPDPGLGPTGLWRYNPGRGQIETLIPPQAADGTLNFVGWPAVTANGRLVYAFANFARLPQGEIPLALFAAQANQIEERFPLRPETLLLRQVLWSPDANLAVLVLPQPGAAGHLAAGPVILAANDGSPARPLLALGYALEWLK